MLFITRSLGTFVNKDATSRQIIMWSIGIFIPDMISLNMNKFFTCEIGDGKTPWKCLQKLLTYSRWEYLLIDIRG